MTRVRLLAIVHPWQSSQEERHQFLRTVVRLAQDAPVEVWSFTGQAHPGAIADHIVQSQGPSLDATQPLLVVLPTGTEGELIAARIAARLGGVSLGRCRSLAVDADGVTATRAAFGGRVTLTLRSDARITCATLRPQSVPTAEAHVPDATEIVLQATYPYPVEAVPSGSGQPRVEGAAIVVSGGRGMGGPEGFEWLSRIASALGAGLGGSLPAVDAGWVPVAHQVGQSGKFVSPRVYFAVAVSGTPQHLAGIGPDTRILALNNDPSASIFSRCDIAVEGDWREILPSLTQELERDLPRH